jgi:hypothetical protein
MLLMYVLALSLSAAVVFSLNVTDVALVVAVPDIGDAVSQLGTLVIEYFAVPITVVSEYLNDDGVNGPPCCPDAAMLVEGVSCSPRRLTVRVAVLVWVPWPVSELVNVIVAAYVLGARVFALAFTVNVTVVPEDAVPDVEDGVSQLGMPEIE